MNSYPKCLVVHDFNHDNNLDIAVASSGTDNVDILLGDGNGTFANQLSYSMNMTSQPSFIAIGDFNNDNQSDIVVANYGSNNIGILLGHGDGTFIYHTILSTGSSRPLWVGVGDFNSDSIGDIVIINYGTNHINIIFGFGNGNFTSPINIASMYDSMPSSGVINDFNNDNKLDLAVVNYGIDNIAIFFGDGNGTFAVKAILATSLGSYPHDIAVADLNHDTKLDIVVVNSGTDTVNIFFGDGHGTFLRQTNYSTGVNSKPISVVLDDFNNDRYVDIAVCNTNAGNILIFLGYGNGSFGHETSFFTGSTSQPYFVVGGDFNNDNRVDIAVANYGTNNIGILLSYSNITFSSQTTYESEPISMPSSVAVGDLNNDRLLDIVVANSDQSSVGVFLGNGHGIFSNQSTHFIGIRTYPSLVAVGDFNNDNSLDIVVVYTRLFFKTIKILLGTNGHIFSNLTTQDINLNYIPSSIAIGDFNNDKRLDIVVCDGSSVIALLFGYGDGNLATPISISIDTRPSSIATGDLNNDGQLDIVIANKFGNTYPQSNVGILFGNGNGTFSNQITFNTGYNAQTVSLAIGDLNNNNQSDIVVTNIWNNNIGILLGYGNGTFSHQKIYTTGTDSNPPFVAVGDFNNDSYLDILIVNRKINGIGVFLGNGNGTFSEQMLYSTSTTVPPKSVALGDFNNDTLLDVVVANYNDKNIGVFLGFSNANFRNGIPLSTGSSYGPCDIVTSDFNNDNQIDFVVANYITNNIEVFLGDGKGNFPLTTLYSTGILSSPNSVTVNDFNNDAQLDIAVANSDIDKIGVFFGYGNGSFRSQIIYLIAAGSHPQSIVSGDFNQDSRPDIVVANYGRDNIDVLLRYDSGSFTKRVLYSTGDGSDPDDIAIGDFNNDHHLDIVVVNNANGNGNGSIGTFLGTGDGTFLTGPIFYTTYLFYPAIIAVGDFDRDNLLDIVVIDNANFFIRILLGNGDGTFTDSTSYYTGAGSWAASLAVVDLNNDTRLDIIVGNLQTNTLGILLGIGDGSFSQGATYRTGNGGGLTSVATGDFNNDGWLDIAISSTWNNGVGILLGNGDGTFSDQTVFPGGTTSQPSSIAVGDFDNDSRLDIVVANKGTDNVGVLFGYGNGTFSDQITLSSGVGSQPTSVTVGDFNNDGRPDIAVANSQNNIVGVFISYVNRIFFSQTAYFIDYNSFPASLAVGDFNNDSRLDIAVCNPGNENIGIFLGYSHEDFSRLSSYTTGLFSQPIYVAVEDFNNDTKLDIVVANYGTNNIMILLGSSYATFTNQILYSTGNNSQPRSIAIRDLNNDTKLDIVVANSGTDNIGILFGNGDGTFSNQTTYATGIKSKPSSVIIDDFNNDTRLDIAVANYGSNYVVLFFGNGNGSFTNQTKYSVGFNSRPFALTAGDVNKDNLIDVIIANNGYGNIVILSKLCEDNVS